MQRIVKSLVLAGLMLGVLTPSSFAADFISSFDADVWHDAGQTVVETQAGSTPDTGVTDFDITNTLGTTPEQIKNIRVDLPSGLISNPAATPLCTQTDFSNDNCDKKSQIGEVELTAVGVTPPPSAVYNLVPDKGHVSDFGFKASFAGLPSPLITHIIGGVRDTTDFGLFFTINDVPNGISLSHSRLTFYGNPAAKNGGGGTAAPFIRLPTACVGPQTTTLTIETYQGNTYKKDSVTNDHAGHEIGASGCNQVPFAPTLDVTPSTTQRDAPIGALVSIGVPWQSDPTKLASAHVKNTIVTLPPGMSISPSAANGLQACTDAQFAQGTHDAITCPDASKVGTATIETPVLPGAHPGEGAKLTGPVYLGQPLPGNPYRLFVDAENADVGLIVRLKGTVTPDPVTGQLTTTFANTPQVPFTHFNLNLNPGPNATLASPLACGQAATTSAISPYSGNADATPGSSYAVDLDGNGGACPPTPFALGFSAGTSNLAAGAFSPFVLNVTRDDGQQFLSGLTIRQPPGLLGVIQSVPLCAESDAAAGTCPEASRVGTSTVASGPGPAPFSITGPVYLTGPFGGGPFGLAIVIHAVAGPFDLGTVVVRAAIKVDKTDSHLVIETPVLPTILQGIPLRLRTVNVTIDRANFIFNPTSCDPLAVGATFKSSDGATQDVSTPFQATGCDALPYNPKMTVTTRATKKGAPAPLTVTLNQAPGEANSKSVSVHLPPVLAANFPTLNKACPPATFEADPKTCPAGSKVGTVSAATPLLADPLGGVVYLEAHTPPNLPTLEAQLEGSGITVGLSGTIVLGGGITSTFGAVPDVPITSFKLNLPATGNPALAANADLCSAPLPMTASLLAQSGKKVDLTSTVGIAGCGVTIKSAKVKGRKVTVTATTPAAGSVAFSGGKNLTGAKKSATAAGTVKATLKLSKKGVAALKKALKKKAKRGRKLNVKVFAKFTPAKGAMAGGEAVKSSQASRGVTFKR